MSEADEMREAVRADLVRAFGPAVVHDALETEEARSYIAARREADAREAEFRRQAAERAQEIVKQLDDSLELPEGTRFEWTT